MSQKDVAKESFATFGSAAGRDEYTEFHNVSHQLFRQTVEGTLKLDVEKKLRQLGEDMTRL
jgi:hypothetical protein